MKKDVIDRVCYLLKEAPEFLSAANKMPPPATTGGSPADHPHALTSAHLQKVVTPCFDRTKIGLAQTSWQAQATKRASTLSSQCLS